MMLSMLQRGPDHLNIHFDLLYWLVVLDESKRRSISSSSSLSTLRSSVSCCVWSRHDIRGEHMIFPIRPKLSLRRIGRIREKSVLRGPSFPSPQRSMKIIRNGFSNMGHQQRPHRRSGRPPSKAMIKSTTVPGYSVNVLQKVLRISTSYENGRFC